MPKRPYFPLYVDDFVSDGKVEAMTTEEVGAYILLLCKAWKETPPASVPDNDAVLARWTRLSPERWSECKPAVLSAFTRAQDGRWYQKRMRQEYAKFVNLSRSRADAGRKGADKRWHDADGNCYGKANGKAMANVSVSESVSGSGSDPPGNGGAGGKGVRRSINDGPPEDAPDAWARWLYREWCHYFTGTARKAQCGEESIRWLQALVERFGGAAVRDGIRSKERARGQATWEFEKWLEREHPKRRQVDRDREEVAATLATLDRLEKGTANGNGKH